MKVIIKSITRSDFTSKMPGVIPSIMDSWHMPSIPFKCSEDAFNRKYFTYEEAKITADAYNISQSNIVYGADFVSFYEGLKDTENGNYGLIPSDIYLPVLEDDNGEIDLKDIENITKESDYYKIEFNNKEYINLNDNEIIEYLKMEENNE